MTWSGRQFWPLDPRPEEVALDDIAVALAHQGRYNGHTRHFYSVAQHSCELAAYFKKRGEIGLARFALMHDATEAYVGDIIRPLKPYLANFGAIEMRLERVIFDRFGLLGELPVPVKDADTRILTDEFLALFPREAVQLHRLDKRARLDIEIRALTPTAARDRFMATHRELW